MINYRIELYLNDPDAGYWISKIYAGSDLLTTYVAASKLEAKKLAAAFIDGVKFARSE